ncbi:GxxExxY protein [Humisphaera borealis]|uniref:GxxExxY protein n=1 Tax=Humisphaera borealis TaxID=2807512 RepID=A0A7M2WX13_9BACT|nr:GxxExxY protein [Humisphaera borealis]QOV89361.1 GxxExxY protein [Humisphaera borealis]
MPYDNELLPGPDLHEPPEELDILVRRVNGAAIEVHRRLGAGLPESSYENAMAIEMTERGIPFERQKRLEIFYKGVRVGYVKVDFLVDGKLIVELKSVVEIMPPDRRQVKTYMRIIRQPLGLLLNFNVALMREGIHRIIASDFDP